MRAIRMTAKKAGTCTTCRKAITTGQPIYWQRGAGAYHVNCDSAAAAQEQYDRQSGKAIVGPCWKCKSPAGRFRSRGPATPVYCDRCDAIDAFMRDLSAADRANILHGATNQEAWDRAAAAYDHSQHVPAVDRFDMDYEDSCARSCGLI